MTLSAAGRLMAVNGKPIKAPTIVRWIKVGVILRGGQILRLKGTRLAGRWTVTESDLNAFIAATTADFVAVG
jgi:hypothetical protein